MRRRRCRACDLVLVRTGGGSDRDDDGDVRDVQQPSVVRTFL